jgi:acetyltransferase-like isoleucine patch superfamily enzyme
VSALVVDGGAAPLRALRRFAKPAITPYPFSAMKASTSAVRVANRLLRFQPWPATYHLELGDAHVEGRIWLPGDGRVRIGHGARLIARCAAIELRAYRGAEIVIEDGAVIEDGTSIEATASVRIGARAHIGRFCKIIDNHFHRTTGDRHERPESVPITIGADAVVGAHAVLVPGAEVGEGAWVGPSAVLSRRLPPQAVFPGTASATTGRA